MRIVLDLQAIQAPANRSRGIGRAYRSLVREIILQRGDHEVLVVISGLLYDYAEEIWAQLSDILPIENFHVWHGIVEVSWHQARQNDTWAYQRRINTILYQSFLTGLKPDVVLFGNFCDGYHDACLLPVPAGAYEIPVVMICYDLIPLVYPQLYDDRTGNGFIDFYREHLAYLKKSHHIFAISESVKDDIVQFLDYSATDITMTSLGFTNLSTATPTSSQVQDVCHKYNIRKPFILYVSAQDPRKNHVGVIEAFARLEPHIRDSYQIVFAGSNFNDLGRLSAVIQANDLPQSVLSVAVHPTDEDLQVLYKLAHLGIFPSLYEGFGLGILESMAFGLPVIASSTSAMPEVMGRNDALFDPTDADDMAAKMAQGLTDEAFRSDLRDYGLEHVEKWDWAACGMRAIAGLEHAHSKAGTRLPDGFSARKWAIEQIGALPLPNTAAGAEIDTILANAATAIDLTYPTSAPIERRRIFIDVSEFVHYDYNTGIQRVIKCIVIEMARQLEDVELALVYSHADGIGYHYARNLQDHLLNGKSRRPFDQESTERVVFSDGDTLLHSELTMPQLIRQRFHLQTLREIGVKTVFIVYDLIPINYSFHEGHHAKEAMLSWLSCLLQGDKLISISRATEDDVRASVIEHDLPFQPMVELDWFHLGGDFHNYVHQDAVKRSTSEVLETFREKEIAGLRGKTNFLMVGTIEPRKSHADMLRAMEVLWEKGSDVNLIIVGKVGWLDEKQMTYIKQHPELGRRFFLFNDLTDVQLDEIYHLSTCLLYFSKVEGFGLPLIEAAQHGVPIIVRDAPVFREVCGEHAFYFPDNLSPIEVAPYIEQWLSLHENGEHPTSTNMPWLTWRESIRGLITKIFAAPDPTKRPFASGDGPRGELQGETGVA
ncbi:glycosyltransferase family 1 protein [Brevundimonas sp. G8]|uniref:glycosyltransferase family 4 protein n=1 Tax=Brevundimonas sp. G8 TaxID=1350776 RepID=UPI0012F3C738|nr:glycosyltransferase family 1 protein [Brevundimonas sp. G8]VXC01895.1 putative Glycosyltransferase involved in cell wall bisynthesis [Brevundimonas sp. G8]